MVMFTEAIIVYYSLLLIRLATRVAAPCTWSQKSRVQISHGTLLFFPSKSEIRQTCIIFFGVTTKSFILVCGYFLLHTKLKDNLEKVFGELEKL